MSPAVSRGDTKRSLFRLLSVCPSVRPSCLSCFSRHTSFFSKNSSSTYTIEMKLHIWIYLCERNCHVHDPLLWHKYFWSYSPLSMPGQVTHFFQILADMNKERYVNGCQQGWNRRKLSERGSLLQCCYHAVISNDVVTMQL